MNKYREEEESLQKEMHKELKKRLEDFFEQRGPEDKITFSEGELSELFQLEGKQRGEMTACLDELESEGRLVRNGKGKYRMPDTSSMIKGTIQTIRRGSGFLIPEDGSEDIYISREHLEGAMNGDRVMVRLETGRPRRNGHRSGFVMNILQRCTTEITGTLIRHSSYAFVVSEDRRTGDVYIPEEELAGAAEGDKVRAVITRYADGTTGLRGKIAEIYGRAGDSEAELRSVLHQYHIPESFPKHVTADAHRAIKEVDSGAGAGREDLTEQQIITIDGADAKDLDDAVHVEKKENGNYLLGVHIADVSQYVQEDSPLDREALQRGCSVYLLDAVVPMLPEQLSNGVCSLNENEERLTLSMEAEIDPQGNVVSYRIFESRIRSCARMIYDQVSDILEKSDPELMEKYSAVCPMLFEMKELAEILRAKRVKGGSLDFDLDESCIRLDEKGMPVDIRPAERRTANRLIEEFMLVANQVVAEHFFWLEVPFVYRVHEKPSREKMENFRAFAGTLGYTLRGSLDSIHPAALREILESAQGRPEEGVISRVMLRSMQKADYQPVCSGHFGLGFKYYCHFTSPIRRYPDLMIHRIIKKQLLGELPHTDSGARRLQSQVEEACRISSERERNAIDAERTIEKKKKVQYMSMHLGEQYEGIISGVVSSGFFVELPNTVEGFVPAETLEDDYYELDQQNYRLVGQHTRRVLPVGAAVLVEVERTDLLNDEITLRLVENRTSGISPAPEKKKSRNYGKQRSLEPDQVPDKKNRIRHKKHKHKRRRTKGSGSSGAE